MWQSFYDTFTESMNDQMITVAGKMTETLSAPMNVAATVYILLYGWAVLRGTIQEPVMDFIAHAVKIAIIVGLVGNADTYTQWVGNLITNTLPEFVNNLTDGKGTVPADSILKKAYDISERLVKEASGLAEKIGAIIAGYIVQIAAAVVAIVTFAFFVFFHFGIALMAAIGPLFVAFALFEATRGWFFSWLGQTLNFLLLKLLLTLLSITLIGFYGQIYAKLDGMTAVAAYASYIAGFVLTFLFFFLLPSIAAALSGEAQASTGFAQRSVERFLRSATNPPGGGGSRGGSVKRK